ncbi:hypothetical protein [Sphingomonas sp.]|uniref:hypothetical protein n=1 Tax=Sphingomonas sp. TaxID=28214 RepID=UPI0025E1BBFC|nr:hypothetical protein [Sphingomonas sp.]
MFGSRLMFSAGLGAAMLAATPASAQFYLKSPDVGAPRIIGTEPGMLAQPLPGATPAELRAAMVWNLRAALNVAALQCQFGPTLLTLPNYNAILRDHKVELNDSYAVLTKYFMRTHKAPKAGQTALDQYGTRVYSSYSAVHAQLTFCQTADGISNAAIFTPRGKFGELAAEGIPMIRNSLSRWGEQQFSMRMPPEAQVIYPEFVNEDCWVKGGYVPSRCAPDAKKRKRR